MKKTIYKSFLLALFTLVSSTAYSQDLLANEAPIDIKLKAIDSLALQKQIEDEYAEFPAYDLYPEWVNSSVKHCKHVAIPDSFNIDMRGFCMPTTHTRITSRFGPRHRRMHYGLDVKVYTGDTIRAAFGGRVRMARYQRRGYGHYIVIRHDNGLETIYGHLSRRIAKQDEYVKAGDVIGLGGNTGRSTGSHLHFECRFLGVAINPEKLFDFPHQDVVADTYSFKKKKSLAAVRYHKVRRGDSLGKIASRYGVSISKICRLNGIRRTSTLRIGQIIRCS